ncbi:hypothetical protein DFH09DRAFT_487521 [Mycena vulgaris]|nr:hypothetical protein DFH09DRAFT_487521 [Mycena vulgaris]
MLLSPKATSFSVHWQSFNPVFRLGCASLHVRHTGPSTHLELKGMYLMGSVYSGLRQLYQGKGFDAYSQDVARELGYPLYQMSEQFASRVEEQDESCGDDNSESASTETECIIAPDDADLSANTELVPSTGWTIVMSVQVALMLTLGMLRLYSCLCAARA